MTQLERSIVNGADQVLARDASKSAVLLLSRWASDVAVLSKMGIVKLVVITSAVGFAAAALKAGPELRELVSVAVTAAMCLIGTAFSAAGANALNQAAESRRDSAMHRTRHRPIPDGRMSISHGLIVGLVLSMVGIAVLWFGTNEVAAILSTLTILTYVLIYTPMKPLTPSALWVGAVPGAIPPLIGWAAASGAPWRGLNEAGGWSLFALMFAWQVPHFLALAWKYREDYARGGYRVLPVVDPSGVSTGRTSFVWTIIMMACSLLPLWAMHPQLGVVYGIGAIAGGIFMLWLSIRLMREHSDLNARRLFFGSIVYLPLLLSLLVVDALLDLLR